MDRDQPDAPGGRPLTAGDCGTIKGSRDPWIGPSRALRAYVDPRTPRIIIFSSSDPSLAPGPIACPLPGTPWRSRRGGGPVPVSWLYLVCGVGIGGVIL